jgi:polyisoprenoid-binding protein YceI
MTHGATYVPGYTAGDWTIDPTESTVRFVVRHLLIHKVRGAFGAFAATS